MLQNWAALDSETFEYSQMHSESNALLICLNQCGLFSKFNDFFEPTVGPIYSRVSFRRVLASLTRVWIVQDTPNRYRVMQAWYAMLPTGDMRTLRNHAAEDTPVPSPKLMAAHAALAHVFFETYAGWACGNLISVRTDEVDI